MSLRNSYSSAWEVLPVTLTGGSSITDLVDLGGLRLFALVVPSDWATANITFQMSPDGGTTWANMKDQNGNEIVVTAGASDCVLLNPTQFSSLPFLRLRSGTAASPVVQASSRSIQLVLRSV